MKKAEPSRNHAMNGARGHRIMVPLNKLRARVKAGYGELLAEQREANKVFRVDGLQPFDPLPRKAETLEDVTRGLGLERGTVDQIQKLVGETNPEFTQKTQTQRIFLAQRHLVETLRAMPFIDSDQRMEITKRARAYWKHNYQTEYERTPEVRYRARKSEPSLVIKADKIPGGLADKKKPSDFDPKKLAAGIKVEMEHTSDRAIATEIAMDHLTEDNDYYEKLATIEKAEPTLIIQRFSVLGPEFHKSNYTKPTKYESKKPDGKGGWIYTYSKHGELGEKSKAILRKLSAHKHVDPAALNPAQRSGLNKLVERGWATVEDNTVALTLEGRAGAKQLRSKPVRKRGKGKFRKVTKKEAVEAFRQTPHGSRVRKVDRYNAVVNIIESTQKWLAAGDGANARDNIALLGLPKDQENALFAQLDKKATPLKKAIILSAPLRKAEQTGFDFEASGPSKKEGPPPGYAAVPNSKRGGYRKRKGKGYVYWYPEGKGSKSRSKKRKPEVDVWGPLSPASVKQWRDGLKQAAKLQREIKAEAKAIFEPQWQAWLEKPMEEKRDKSFYTHGLTIPKDFEVRYAKASDAVTQFGRNLQQWAIEHVAEQPHSNVDPDTIKSLARRDITKKAYKVRLSSGFPMHYPAPGSGGQVRAGLAQILNEDYEGKEWSNQLRRARGLLKAVDTFAADIDAENTRRKPRTAIERGGVQFVIHGEGIGAGPSSEAAVEKPFKEVERTQQKLESRGLGKALQGLRVHVHFRSRMEAEGREHQGRSDFTTAGYYNFRDDYVRLFINGITENTLTHELGHRIYFQLMGNQGRREWEKYYEDRREKMSEAEIDYVAGLLNDAETAYAQEVGAHPTITPARSSRSVFLSARRALESEDALTNRAPVQERARRLLDQALLPRSSAAKELFANVRTAEDAAEALRRGVREDILDTAIPDEFVTQYAETNPEELFAEAFEDYVVKGPRGLPPGIRDQLERALRSTGMPLKKSEEEPTLVTTLRKGQARGGRYIKRVPYMKDGKRKYRYYYSMSAVARDVQAGEQVKLGKKVAQILGIGDDGTITVQIGDKTEKVSPDGWERMLQRHYGEKLLGWREKRANQTVNAVLRHVPRALLKDLKGTDAERLAQLKERVPKVYDKLQASFQRSGVSPLRAKAILGEVLDRRGWEPEARAAVIGNVIERKGKGYRQTIRAAENLAGGETVKPGHVQSVVDYLRPPNGQSPKDNLDTLAKSAEKELAQLSTALSAARAGGATEAAQALVAALGTDAMRTLMEAAQAMPGLKDKAIAPVRKKLLEVPSVAPRTKPTREGAESVVYVAGEGGQPRALKARYKLVEAGEAVASHKPGSFAKRDDYPEGVQERAYHRDRDEQAKVIRNAQQLNPAFLVNTNPDAVNGPPIVDQTGVVLGGNSRTMSMQLAYEKHPEKAAAMRDYLIEHAHEVGFKDSDVKAMKNPILVREVVSEGTAEQKMLVRQMNESFTQGMDPRTMQVAMGRKLDDKALQSLGDAMETTETLGAFLDSKRAEPFLNALMRTGIIDQRNSNQYMVKGQKRLNEDGKQLVERVLVGRTVGDADLLSNTGSRLISNIARSVPFMTQAKAYGGTYDLGDDLKVALETYNDLHYRAQQGHRAALTADMSDRDFEQLFAQDEMFGEPNPIKSNPKAMALLEVLIRKNGPQKMAGVFREYAARAAQNPEDQDSMFGDKPSPEALLRQAMAGETKKSMEPTLIVKGGPYIGKRGGKWADPKHTIPWKEPKPVAKKAVEKHLKNAEQIRAKAKQKEAREEYSSAAYDYVAAREQYRAAQKLGAPGLVGKIEQLDDKLYELNELEYQAAAKHRAAHGIPRGIRPEGKIKKARGSTYMTHIPVKPQAGSAPRFHTPPIPDFQDIYHQPESKEKDKLELEQRETRQRGAAQRNRGKYGFHGTPLPLKPVLRWGDEDSAVGSSAVHDPKRLDQRKPRKSPKLDADRRAAADQTTYEDADEHLDDEDNDGKKRKRKKKKKKAKLVARKR